MKAYHFGAGWHGRVLLRPGRRRRAIIRIDGYGGDTKGTQGFVGGRNAAESMDGGAQVRVSTIHLGAWAELTVTDNGRGIANENRSQAFDPFFTTRLSQGGSGLGLSVVHGVIGEHGWSIDIETAPQGGTCFRIGLPLGLAEPA